MPRRRTALFLVVVVALGAGAATLPATASAHGTIRAMTRNLYLGADLLPLIAATSREEFERKATETFQRVQATSFRARAPRLAREIDRTRPDLIGLQEASLWRLGAEGVKDGPQTPATTVAYDYVRLLRRALRRRGLRYRVAARQVEADIEAPTSMNRDVRLTIQDVILERDDRRGLSTRRARGEHFDTRLTIPTAVGPVTVLRGWTSVEARLGHERFRFVNTHLEAFHPGTRAAQARELVAPGGPTATRRPVILVGDLNSDPNDAGGSDSAAFDTVRAAGFRDTWAQLFPSRAGFSCCHAEDLLNPTPRFDERIDHVMVRPRMRVRGAQVVGDEQRNRTRSGLWPSDHGGVVTRLRLPGR